MTESSFSVTRMGIEIFLFLIKLPRVVINFVKGVSGSPDTVRLGVKAGLPADSPSLCLPRHKP